MPKRFLLFAVSVILLSACNRSRMHEHPEWSKYYEAYGIKNACFIIRDNNHEALSYYNKERCLQRMCPASTFKIFNSLVALETSVAPDEQLIIKWDSVPRRASCDKDMNMREAFKESCVGYYQEIARRIGATDMKHYLDTVKYGNMSIGGGIDKFWLVDSLQISADEQVGFVKRLYFNELPFSERSQRIVRSMMVRDETPDYRLSYKTGWAMLPDKQVLWVVGYAERIAHMKEPKGSMNKSDIRQYPYFFAQNFEIPLNDATHDWAKVRIDILYQVLKDFGALPKQ